MLAKNPAIKRNKQTVFTLLPHTVLHVQHLSSNHSATESNNDILWINTLNSVRHAFNIFYQIIQPGKGEKEKVLLFIASNIARHQFNMTKGCSVQLLFKRNTSFSISSYYQVSIYFKCILDRVWRIHISRRGNLDPYPVIHPIKHSLNGFGWVRNPKWF